jgi:general secretion pathway protein G
MFRRGFTLIELLIVIVVLGLIAGALTTRFIKRAEKARIDITETQLKNIAETLKMYRVDNFQYPTTEQGLKALVEKPEVEPVPENWKGPYMESLPKDAWGRDFLYVSDGEHFKVISVGADGEEGTKDDVTIDDKGRVTRPDGK